MIDCSVQILQLHTRPWLVLLQAKFDIQGPGHRLVRPLAALEDGKLATLPEAYVVLKAHKRCAADMQSTYINRRPYMSHDGCRDIYEKPHPRNDSLHSTKLGDPL